MFREYLLNRKASGKNWTRHFGRLVFFLRESLLVSQKISWKDHSIKKPLFLSESSHDRNQANKNFCLLAAARSSLESGFVDSHSKPLSQTQVPHRPLYRFWLSFVSFIKQVSLPKFQTLLEDGLLVMAFQQLE